MRFPRYLTWFVLCLFGLLSACGTSPRYAQDYKSGTDFSNLKTYTWRSLNVEVAGTPDVFIQRLVDEQLQLQGFARVADQADLIVDMQVFSRISAGSNTSLGIGIGVPIGNRGSIGLGTSSPLGRGKEEGVMVIDLTHASTNTLIWRGNAEGIPLIQFKLGAEQKLRDSIAKILAPFPPQAAPKP